MSYRIWRFLLVAACLGIWGQPCSADDVPNNLVYQIFVRSFADGNDQNGVGDLKGIGSRLDSYLNDGKPETHHDLEVGILWLMPIFPADSYHGYDVSNYQDVNSQYGTLADLKDLIQQCHQRGVRIILDIPFNHTSVNHDWFKQALAGNASLRQRYFMRGTEQPLTDGWHETTVNGAKVRYFGLFDKSMPDLNYDNADVRSEVKKIAKFWLDLGIDGFRLDAAKHIYIDSFGTAGEPEILKNNDWWLEFSNHCYSINPKAVLVGEVLGGSEIIRRHAYGLDGLLDEPFMHDARNQMAFPQPGFVGRLNSDIRADRDVSRLAPHREPHRFEPFLFVGSHDENPRLGSFLEDAKRRGMQADVEQAYRVGMYYLLMLGQVPVIYNGDELMQRGFKWNGNGDGSGVFDETLREPFPWYQQGTGAGQTTWFKPRFDQPNDGVSREEQEADGGMLNLVRGITNLRTSHPNLANGELGETLSDTQDWSVFERVGSNQRYLVLINPTKSGKDYSFHEGWYPRYLGAQLIFWSDGGAKKWADETSNGKNIDRSVFVPPYGLVVIKQK